MKRSSGAIPLRFASRLTVASDSDGPSGNRLIPDRARYNGVFGGKGVGLIKMLVYLIGGVFLSGLMVGRTPEYLGKKVEARESSPRCSPARCRG